MMSFYRDHWQNVGAFIFVLLTVYLVLWGQGLNTVETLLVLSFMALLAHQFEEYTLPGGAGLVINAVMYGERKDYDRYPGNKQSCMIVNTFAAYPFYIIAFYFSEYIWLGLAVIFFGLFQLIGHGLVMNIKGRTWYNPGLATTLFMFVPIGVYFIYYVNMKGLISAEDYLYAFFTFLSAIFIILFLPIRILMDRNSPYPMTVKEMSKFNMLYKVKRKGIIDS